MYFTTCGGVHCYLKANCIVQTLGKPLEKIKKYNQYTKVGEKMLN